MRWRWDPAQYWTLRLDGVTTAQSDGDNDAPEGGGGVTASSVPPGTPAMSSTRNAASLHHPLLCPVADTSTTPPKFELPVPLNLLPLAVGITERLCERLWLFAVALCSSGHRDRASRRAASTASTGASTGGGANDTDDAGDANRLPPEPCPEHDPPPKPQPRRGPTPLARHVALYTFAILSSLVVSAGLFVVSALLNVLAVGALFVVLPFAALHRAYQVNPCSLILSGHFAVSYGRGRDGVDISSRFRCARGGGGIGGGAEDTRAAWVWAFRESGSHSLRPNLHRILNTYHHCWTLSRRPLGT